jgi:hypothetical protein
MARLSKLKFEKHMEIERNKNAILIAMNTIIALIISDSDLPLRQKDIDTIII